MNITIGKITRDPLNLNYQIRIDRGTIMGNPFFLKQDSTDGERDFNLKVYRLYLNLVIRKGAYPMESAARLANQYELFISNTFQKSSREEFMNEFNRMVELAKIKPIELMCFCSPKKCHGDILKSAIEWSIVNV
jgi:Domain of unknown function (DUF4326)